MIRKHFREGYILKYSEDYAVSLFLKGSRPFCRSKSALGDISTHEGAYSTSRLSNNVPSDFIPNMLLPFYITFPAVNKALRRN